MKILRLFQIIVSLTIFIINSLILVISLFFRDMFNEVVGLDIPSFGYYIMIMLISGIMSVINLYVLSRKVPKNVVYEQSFADKFIAYATIIGFFMIAAIGLLVFNIPDGYFANISRGLLIFELVTLGFVLRWYMTAKYLIPGFKYHIPDNNNNTDDTSES